MAVEAGVEVTLAAGACVHPVPSAQDLVAALGVPAPRQTTTPVHVGANNCLGELCVLCVCVCVCVWRVCVMESKQQVKGKGEI